MSQVTGWYDRSDDIDSDSNNNNSDSNGGSQRSAWKPSRADPTRSEVGCRLRYDVLDGAERDNVRSELGEMDRRRINR